MVASLCLLYLSEYLAIETRWWNAHNVVMFQITVEQLEVFVWTTWVEICQCCWFSTPFTLFMTHCLPLVSVHFSLWPHFVLWFGWFPVPVGTLGQTGAGTYGTSQTGLLFDIIYMRSLDILWIFFFFLTGKRRHFPGIVNWTVTSPHKISFRDPLWRVNHFPTYWES